jgi:hypothetical protein
MRVVTQHERALHTAEGMLSKDKLIVGDTLILCEACGKA